MSKKTASTEVVTVKTGSILIPTNKKEVSITIEQLKEHLKLLKGEGSDKVDLEMSLGGVKIKDMTKVGQLLRTSSNVFAQEEAYNKEIKRYNLEKMNIKPFDLDGRTSDKWEKAIGTQIHQVINQSQIIKTEQAIKDLSQFLSENEKLQTTLANIAGSVTEFIE